MKGERNGTKERKNDINTNVELDIPTESNKKSVSKEKSGTLRSRLESVGQDRSRTCRAEKKEEPKRLTSYTETQKDKAFLHSSLTVCKLEIKQKHFSHLSPLK